MSIFKILIFPFFRQRTSKSSFVSVKGTNILTISMSDPKRLYLDQKARDHPHTRATSSPLQIMLNFPLDVSPFLKPHATVWFKPLSFFFVLHQRSLCWSLDFKTGLHAFSWIMKIRLFLSLKSFNAQVLVPSGECPHNFPLLRRPTVRDSTSRSPTATQSISVGKKKQCA